MMVANCKKPVSFTLTTEYHCKYCGALMQSLTDSLTSPNSDLGSIRLTLQKSKAAHVSGFKARTISAALARGKSSLTRRVSVSTCDFCGNSIISVKTGTIWRCSSCKKEYRHDVYTKRIKRKDAAAYSVTRKKGLCGSRACRLKKKHPEWNLAACGTIAQGKIQLGFTKDQVVGAWGRPNDINRTVGSWGTHEQWVYDRGAYNYQFIYFENGIVTSWQD